MSEKSLAEALEEAFREAKDMATPLGDRLAHVATAVRRLSPPFADEVDRLVNRLKENTAGISAPKPGDIMPDFLLPDLTGALTSLSELTARGPVALAFHRGHWCPYCRLSTLALADARPKAEALGGQIVAITPDAGAYARKFFQDTKADIPVLIDMDNGYALNLDLAIWVHEKMQQMIAAAGWDIPCYQGNEGWMLPIPATFIVGRDGRVKARFVDPDYRKRMDIDDLLTALKSAG